MKNQPERMCIACRKKGDKNSFIRIVKNNDGIFLDKTGKLAGRGAYICNSKQCLQTCIKQKALNRTFKQEISQETYTSILSSYEQN